MVRLGRVEEEGAAKVVIGVVEMVVAAREVELEEAMVAAVLVAELVEVKAVVKAAGTEVVMAEGAREAGTVAGVMVVVMAEAKVKEAMAVGAMEEAREAGMEKEVMEVAEKEV